MHHTSKITGSLFAEAYCKDNFKILDVGGLDMNGSLRKSFEEKNATFVCMDMHQHSSVDLVVPPGSPFPFSNGYFDIVVSTSCFEHDPCFWLTFKEMCRVTKLGGYIYVNAPSNGPHHEHPGDNWRFYRDAGQSLAYWSGISCGNEEVFPVCVEETFFVEPPEPKDWHIWRDFVCVWKRVTEKQTEITISKETITNVGPLKQAVQNKLEVSQNTPY